MPIRTTRTTGRHQLHSTVSCRLDSPPVSVKMPIDELRFLENDPAQRTADAAALREHMAVLSGSRILPEACDVDNMLLQGFTVDDIGKMAKSLKPFFDQKIFEDLWSKAHGAGIVISAQALTFGDLFHFKKWLTTPAGVHAVGLVQAQKKLTKAGKTVMTHQDVAVLRLFDSNVAEMKRGLKAKKEACDARVAELQAEIDECKKKYAKAERKRGRAFPIAMGYKPQEENELKNACWDMYVLECDKAGTPVVQRSSDNLNIVKKKYGDRVKDDHKLAYAKMPDNYAGLIDYGKKKVLKAGKEGAVRSESSFRNLVTIISPEAAATLPPPLEGGVDDEPSDGEDPGAAVPDEGDAAKQPADAGTATETPSGGDQGGTTSEQAARNRKRKSAAVDAEQSDPNLRSRKHAKAGGHPHRSK